MIKTLGVALLTAVTFQTFTSVNEFHSSIPQPVQVKEDFRLTATREALTLLGAPKDKLLILTRSCYHAAMATNLDPVLVACLMRTESEFKVTAKSNKNYQGLMQVPKAEMKWSRAEADVFKGCTILREKLQTNYANGNTLKALQLYKGGNNKEAMKYATQTDKLYRQTKEKLELMKG